MVETSRARIKRKSAPTKNPIPHRETYEFERIHFPTGPLARHFQTRIIGCKVIDSYSMELDDFEELVVCNRSVKQMLEPQEVA